MPVIIVVGPNAIGKTTAIQRWSRKYSRLVAISADLGVEYLAGEEVGKDKRWSGSVEEKTEMVYRQYNRKAVVVVESARTDIVRFMLTGQLLAIVTTPEAHEANMRRRCEARGKKYRADYWTYEKLKYESFGRYVNAAQKNRPEAHTIVELESQETGWPKADEVFAFLHRKLNNELQRGQS